MGRTCRVAPTSDAALFHHLRIADHQQPRRRPETGLLNDLGHNLGPDSRRIAHRDADNRSICIHRAVPCRFMKIGQIVKTIFTGPLRRVSSSTAA